MALKDNEIKYLRRLAEKRGKRDKPPRDPDEIRQQKQLEKQILDFLLNVKDRKALIEALTDRFGLQVGSEYFERALQAWDLCQRGRKKPSR